MSGALLKANTLKEKPLRSWASRVFQCSKKTQKKHKIL